MRKSLRYLRITWTATCGVACVLLIVLWVRSYWWQDTASLPVGAQRTLDVGSTQGQVLAQTYPNSLKVVGWLPTGWGRISHPISDAMFADAPKQPWFSCGISNGAAILICPHGFFASLALAAGIMPWLRWRFTLRTLLIATTLVAVALGLIMWSVR